MPHKFNAARRDKITKQKLRVTNWSEYNEGLRQRGDLTVWISKDALGLWSAPPRTTRGGSVAKFDGWFLFWPVVEYAFAKNCRRGTLHDH
jgi:hypothetical protein